VARESFIRKSSSPYDIEILVALPDGEGSGPWEEFMAEDFSDEDVLGHVYGFKAVAADSGVGASQVAWFPGLVQGAEGVGDVLRELGAGGGVDGIGGGKGFEARSLASSAMIFFGSARTGMG